MSETAYRIGDLGRLTGTKVVTIRYYEKVGLLPEAPRSAGNYRIYGTDDLNRLRFIRRCRNLGFSVDQVKDLVALSSDERRPCGEVDDLTRLHLEEIEGKIADLNTLAAELRRISASCDGATHISNCRIIEALSGE